VTLDEPLDYPTPPLPDPLPPTDYQEYPNASSPPGTEPCPTTTLQPGTYGYLEFSENVTLQGGPPETHKEAARRNLCRGSTYYEYPSHALDDVSLAPPANSCFGVTVITMGRAGSPPPLRHHM